MIRVSKRSQINKICRHVHRCHSFEANLKIADEPEATVIRTGLSHGHSENILTACLAFGNNNMKFKKLRYNFNL